MKRATRVERLGEYYGEFAPDYVATWKSIEGYGAEVREFLRSAVGEGAGVGGRVLDVGCGPGQLTEGLPRSVEVVGCDISERMLSMARRRRPHGSYHIHDYHEPIPRAWGRFDAALDRAMQLKPKGHDFVLDRTHTGPALSRHMSVTGG